MIGERIGHLRVIASIGVGGMGAVWHAVDELLDRHVALKVIRPELMSRPGLAERFRSEAIVLARLQHPCIAALYGLEKRGEEFVMVMEYVDGQTLDTRLAVNGALPWPEATRITRAVLDALDHAHESGVIHRDIKPANVMITRAGRVKVMDFGIARLVGAQRQTRTGAAVGTPSYMSPEQLLGQEVDGRSDVYAVGTLLYELTTGHLPFEVEGDYMRMIAQLQQVPSAPSTHNAELPPALDRIVARALMKEPADRFATSGEFRDALEELEREYNVLRPYGTPAAGSSSVPGGGPPTGRGTPSSVPAVGAPQPTPSFNLNSSALLTPVESAMSVTPVPFAVEPAGATPIDLNVPANFVAAAAAAQPSPATPVPEPAPVSMPTPEFVVAQPPAEVIVGDAAPAQRGGISRTLLAGGAIVVVAIAGVLISGKLKTSEKAASSATPAAGATVAVATTPAANPPAVTPPAQTPPTPIVVATPAPKAAEPIVAVDSAAVKKAIADSVARAKRAARDSARAAAAKEAARVADSIEKAKTSPFVIGPSPDEIKAATLQARNGARDCVDALSAHDMPRLKALFARDHTDEVFRIANERRLEASGVQKAAVEVEAADRAKVGFQTVLSWKNANNEDKSVIASLRNIVQKKNGTWSNRCFIDNDGGARY